MTAPLHFAIVTRDLDRKEQVEIAALLIHDLKFISGDELTRTGETDLDGRPLPPEWQHRTVAIQGPQSISLQSKSWIQASNEFCDGLMRQLIHTVRWTTRGRSYHSRGIFQVREVGGHGASGWGDIEFVGEQAEEAPRHGDDRYVVVDEHRDYLHHDPLLLACEQMGLSYNQTITELCRRAAAQSEQLTAYVTRSAPPIVVMSEPKT